VGIWKRGAQAGLKTAWTLGKIIFPITFILTILQFTPVLPWVTELIAPFMRLIGLPGEAAIPLSVECVLLSSRHTRQRLLKQML